MIIGDRITQRREDLLLTQEDIAKYIGVRVETIDNWERGFSNPQKSNLQSLAKVLQTSINYLEGSTDIAADYSYGDNECIICGKSVPYGVAKCPECCWGKWSASSLNSKAQSSRRKRSHQVTLESLDREKARAEFTSVTSYGVNTYRTSLDMCTCPDFEERHMPCKHIFRLADELGLIHCEEFAPDEDDYTMHFDSVRDSVPDVAEPETVSETHSEVPAVKAEQPETNSFMKFIKFIAQILSCAIALFFLLGAITQGKEWLCFPAGFAVAGFLVAMSAKRKLSEGSTFKWWLYGALVPVVSWIDIVMMNSQNKVKGFLKGLAYTLVGLFVFLSVFVYFIPPASSEILGYLGENQVLIDPNDDADDEISQTRSDSTEVSVNVVVTPKGKKYHYAGCRTVKKKYRTLTVAQARRQGYKPCKVCNPPSR